MKTSLRILTVIGVGLAAAAAGSADTLGPSYDPAYSLRILGQPTSHVPATLSDGFESASLNATAPSVEAFGSSDSTHGQSVGVSDLRYYFEITGPAGPVPLDISAHFLLEFENPQEAGDYDSNNNFTFLRVSDGNACCASEASYGGDPNLPYGTVGGFGEYQTTFHSTAQANSIITVEMEVQAAGVGTGFGHALINDFSIGFGPNFDSTGYSIALSSGIGNGQSATPEPASILLISGALIGIIGLKRCSLRRASRAACFR